MLTALTILNVVLIERLTVRFESGFCALTGETGAGKSILLDSLGLALGGRAESRLVRKGQDEASVTAAFDVSAGHPVFAVLAEAGVSVEKGEAVILRRVLKADGGSRAFINDQPVSVALLREAGGLLAEVHGQFETQGLLDPKTHRALLDEYAGVDTAGLSGAWEGWREADAGLARAREDMAKARADEAYLRAALEDLDGLAPQPGEEQKLSALREKLMRRDQMIASLNGAHEALAQAEDIIGKGYRLLERNGEAASAALSGIDRALAELQEAQVQVESLSADLEDPEFSLPEIDDRLFALRGQARKHGCAVDGLPEKREEMAAALALIDGQDHRLAGLISAAEKARGVYVAKAAKAHETRVAAAARLDAAVARELPPLKLDKAGFVTQVAKSEEGGWGAGGFDTVQFLVSTNPGSVPGSLHKIASGGEMARFMLALKVVTAQTGAAATLVFDEVDSGIGGATASAVGDRLARLARDKQILVVTHSPQVAARAAHHWIVLKDGKKEMTTKVIPLPEVGDRREEIARMLAGSEVTAEARAAAGRLLGTGT